MAQEGKAVFNGDLLPVPSLSSRVEDAEPMPAHRQKLVRSHVYKVLLLEAALFFTSEMDHSSVLDSAVM
jgi:hypothetical protein